MSKISALFITLLTYLPLPALGRCPPGFVQGHTVHSCYTYKTTPLPWEEAVKECMLVNGHLPAIQRYMENLYVLTLPNLELARYYWIGASRGVVDSDGWTWPDGTPVKFANWNYCKLSTENDVSGTDGTVALGIGVPLLHVTVKQAGQTYYLWPKSPI